VERKEETTTSCPSSKEEGGERRLFFGRLKNEKRCAPSIAASMKKGKETKRGRPIINLLGEMALAFTRKKELKGKRESF